MAVHLTKQQRRKLRRLFRCLAFLAGGWCVGRTGAMDADVRLTFLPLLAGGALCILFAWLGGLLAGPR